MVDIAAHRKFVGNVCLYRGVAVRLPRSFLQRNINTVLDGHARQLLAKPTSDKPYEAMVANERSTAGWDYPTYEMLRDLVKGEKPLLKIDALQLRSLSARGNNHWQVPQQSHDNEGPEWLPHPTNDLQLPCQVSVSIVETNRRAIYTQPQQATVSRRQKTGGGNYYDITLDKPFLIELDKLFVATESGTNGFRHWKRTVTTKHVLEIAIQCQDSDDTAELLSQLESAEVSNYNKAPASEGVIRAIWANLPQCPSRGHLLQLKRARGHASLDLPYGMDISMGWARRKDSPLELHNRLRSATGRQFPTPSASDDQEATRKEQYVVRYSFQEGAETRTYTQDDLSCIWCQSVAGQPNKTPRGWYDKLALPCRSLDRLRLHYITCHDHFRPEVGEIVSAEGKHLVPIAFSLTDRPSSFAATDKPALEDYSWVAPNRPFNISAHVAGDESWIGGSKVKPKRGAGRPSKLKEDAEPGATPLAIMSKKRPNLDEVQDLPVPKRMKYTVPDVAGVTFYHTRSKQQVEAGDELSESDDEVYENRLIRSQRRNFNELGLSEVVCNFHEAFNRHVDAEQPSSTTLVKDAVVRFARKHQAMLWEDEWRRTFEEKLEYLRLHGVIDGDVVTFCLNRQLSDADDKPEDELRADQDDLQADDKKSDDVSGDTGQLMNGVEPSQIRNGHGRFAKTNKDSAEPEPKPKQHNGRFTRAPDSPANGASPRSKKPHRWSGGGADRDIVQAGRVFLPNGHASGAPANKSQSREPSAAQSRAGATPTREKSQSNKTSRFRWEGGIFVRYDDGNAAQSPAVDSARAVEASELPNGHAVNKHATNGDDDEEQELPSVAHRIIQYTREAESQASGSSTGYAFVKEAVRKSADDIVAADLDFGKFVKRLRQELEFDEKHETLVCNSADVNVEVTDERQWQQVLTSWEARQSLQPLLFEIIKKHRSTSKKDARAASTTNGVSNGKQKNAQQSQPQRSTNKKKGICLCGKPAEGSRGCIACDNPGCDRGTFHTACVGLKQRSTGWRCTDCPS